MPEVLATKTTETELGHKSIYRISTTQGCPQGGVLSSFMWGLVLNGLVDDLTNLYENCHGFVMILLL